MFALRSDFLRDRPFALIEGYAAFQLLNWESVFVVTRGVMLPE